MNRFALPLALLLAAPLARAETFLWRVSDGDAHLFLGGTLHVLDADDYPLPAAFDTAFEAADALVLETDVRELEDPARRASMLRALTYADGERIFDVLDDDTDARLEGFLTERGLPVEAFATFRPGLLLSALTVIELQRLGVDAQGVDGHYLDRAAADGVPLRQLERPEEQIGMLAGLGAADPDRFVDGLLDEVGELGPTMDAMRAAWRDGDAAALERTAVAPMRETMPEGHASLLVERNRRWLPAIVAMLDSPDVELVLVGAGHLVGEDGLLDALREAGYALEQL